MVWDPCLYWRCSAIGTDQTLVVYCDAQSRSIDAEWRGSGVSSFSVRGGRIGPDTLVSGVNLRVLTADSFSITGGYNLTANQDYISHGFNLGVNFSF